jgi:hypothetical protein
MLRIVWMLVVAVVLSTCRTTRADNTVGQRGVMMDLKSVWTNCSYLFRFIPTSLSTGSISLNTTTLSLNLLDSNEKPMNGTQNTTDSHPGLLETYMRKLVSGEKNTS